MGILESIGKAFEKKYCSICEEEIGLFGNNKLEDGNMCDSCAAKLTPYFPSSKYKTTSVELIKKQLGYRRKNKKLLKEFKTTRIIGLDGMRLLVDEKNQQFVALHAKKELSKSNPDIIKYNLILGARLELKENESKTELTYIGKDGQTKKYNPPRYKYSYSYDVFVVIDVRKKYFKQMRIQVNDYTIYSETKNPSDYKNCKAVGQQMVDFLLKAQEEGKVEEAPKQAVTCPWCGATTFPTENGCCEYCGGSLNG